MGARGTRYHLRGGHGPRGYGWRLAAGRRVSRLSTPGRGRTQTPPGVWRPRRGEERFDIKSDAMKKGRGRYKCPLPLHSISVALLSRSIPLSFPPRFCISFTLFCGFYEPVEWGRDLSGVIFYFFAITRFFSPAARRGAVCVRLFWFTSCLLHITRAVRTLIYARTRRLVPIYFIEFIRALDATSISLCIIAGPACPVHKFHRY